MACPSLPARLLLPSDGGRRQQDHRGIWKATFPLILKSKMLAGLQILVWCPFSCSPPCCSFARLSFKECPMRVCKAGNQRCLLGPFVFSSWDRMAWMLLKIFFWWPIMVMPRLRTSLENKNTVRHPSGLDLCQAPERHCSSPRAHPRDQPRGLCRAPLHLPISTRLLLRVQGHPPGTERLPFPWAHPPDRTVTALGSSRSGRGITLGRLAGGKVNALKLDSVLVGCSQITQSERRMDDEPSPLKSFPDAHEKQGLVSAQSHSKDPSTAPDQCT